MRPLQGEADPFHIQLHLGGLHFLQQVAHPLHVGPRVGGRSPSPLTAKATLWT